MYGENSHLMRTELSELLRQHRIQPRLGGHGSHTIPVTTTDKEREQAGYLIRRYRQSALVWCHQASVAVAPAAALTLTKQPANPFRIPATKHGPIAALQHALGYSLHASTAALPSLEELTTRHEMPFVEHWRHIARAAALGEHDFDAALGTGRLGALQCQTVIGDIAAIVRALIVLDQRYRNIPDWEKLARPDRLGWSALACALDASLDPPDYSVDLRGWRPPTKVIAGPAKPGLLGVLQAEHNLVIRLQVFPSAINLRLVVDSQRLLSGGLARLVGATEPSRHEKWLAREQTYLDLQRELRNIGSRVGIGGLAVTEGANAVSRLNGIRTDSDVDPRALHGFDKLFTKLDQRVADIVEEGITRQAYLARVNLPQVIEDSAMVARAGERYRSIPEAKHSAILGIVRDRLRPSHDPSPTSALGATSRAELHAAIVHSPQRRGEGVAI